MKFNKNAYLFAAALVVGTMGMTSCSNNEVDDITAGGVENKVTLAMSVADKFGTRSTADEVNMGSKLQTIKNVTVVPMIGKAYQNPIVMGDLNPTTAADKTVKKTAPLNSKVNYFKVYGNVPADNFDATKIFTGFKLEATARKENIGSWPVCDPHGLYYYGYAGTSDNQIQVGDQDGSYSSLKSGDPVGSKKFIKLHDVNYAVGVLAAAILNGDTEACIYDNQGLTGVPVVVSKENVTVSGIIVDGQTKTLDQDFNAVKGDPVKVYEEAAVANFVTTENKLAQGKTNTGNIYCIVTETGTTKRPGKAVTGNIEFTLAPGKFLKLNNNKTIGSADAPVKFYLAYSLQPTEDKAVFMKDYSTLFNATVKDWGLASDQPVEVTDANIAVTIDMDWQQGIVYDQDI